MTVYWVVWDAAASWIVDRLTADGSLPAVHALRSAGSRAAARPPAPNCQTPPSLATLFTGTWSQEHGVTGFSVPAHDTAGGHQSGFAARFPARPPVWRTLAERGRSGAFVHAPWVFGDSDTDGTVGAVGPGVDAAIEAYQGRVARHDLFRPVGATTACWPVGDLPIDIEIAGDSSGATLRANGVVHELTPERDWVAVRLDHTTGFWVRHIGDAVVRTGSWRVRTAGSNEALVRRLAETPVFAGEGLGSLYRKGIFGPRLTEGGNGRAEEMFLSSVDCVVRSFDAAVRMVLAGHRADLVVIYLPWTDDVGHELAGWCDERSAAYRPDVAGRVWELLRRCYREADRLLGQVLRRATERDTVLLSADHGIVGGTHLVHVNELLIRSGLAARGVDGVDGGLDLNRSEVVYHPANNGLLVVNHDGLAGGIVPTGQVGQTMRRAMAALVRHGPYVTGFLDGHARPVGWHDAGSTAYLVLANDCQPSAAVDGGAVLRSMPKSGAHVINTGDGRLHATFAAMGPGVPAGADLGVVPNTLGARLVLHHLGAGPKPDVLAGLGGTPR